MSSTRPEPLPRIDRLSAPWSATLAGVKLHFGPGARSLLPEIVAGLGSRRPLVVTDPEVRRAAGVDSLIRALHERGLHAAIFDAVQENPTSEHVEAGRRAAAAHGADLLVGYGGGSAMDAAKGVNLVLTNGGVIDDYHGYGKATHPLLPSVGVPTTAGTGSEAQSYALIARATDHLKMACGDPGARFHEVVLDPELTATAPRAVAFAAGVDAVAHAVESHVCARSNPVSRLYAREAFRLLHGAIEKALAHPSDRDAAGRMLFGAHLAGASIEASMLGAAHACANPLTARYGIVHGVAVGLMLPHVARYNQAVTASRYDELLRAAGSADDMPATLRRIWALGGVPARLSAHGVARADLPELACEAAAQWTAGFNPRPAGEQELLVIYEAAY